jgi:hypothetical protein
LNRWTPNMFASMTFSSPSRRWRKLRKECYRSTHSINHRN